MVKNETCWRAKEAQVFIQPAHSLHREVGVLECCSYNAVYTFTVGTQGGTVLEPSCTAINYASGQS